MDSERSEKHYLSLEEQFDHPEVFELGGQEVEVTDIRPETRKTEMPVVVAPGWAADRTVIQKNILGLAEMGRRTLTLDAQHGIPTESIEGFPEAELRKAAAIIELLKAKGLEQVDAVGHSEASINLAIAATMQPELFRNMVLVDPGGMIGEDKTANLMGRFSLDILKQSAAGLWNSETRETMRKASAAANKAIISGPRQTFKEVQAIANTRIHDLLRGLREKGVGVSIIHAVDDQAFPMERVQQIAKKDMLNGFYSVKGTHNIFYLHPERYTELIDSALDALENRKIK